MSGPATQLMGRTLSGGWKVIERIKRLPQQTGGNFSQGYVVVNANGIKAFLKALDFAQAMSSADPARALEAVTTAYNFERDLLERCRRMDRVVKSLADGKVLVTDDDDREQPVQYLIFELADGDVRKYKELSDRFYTAWVAGRASSSIADGALGSPLVDSSRSDVGA